ncbi:MAG: hypothetical protein AB1894_04880 [Chloroflexota bacterium]
MRNNRLKQCFYLLLMWLVLNLFTAFAFGFVADREIASRDFPAHDPFFVSKLIDYSDDLFLPMIRTPMIVFGSFTGIFIFVGGYLRRFVRSSFAGHVIWGGGILFTILTLGGALLLENMKADSVECNLAGGTLFGCWPRSNLQSWHLVIWICWSFCIAISGYFGRRRFFPRGLPLWLVTFAAAFTLAGCTLSGASIATPVRRETPAVTISSMQASSPTASASSTVKVVDPSSTPIPSRQPTSTATL